MKMKKSTLARICLLLVFALIGLACTVELTSPTEVPTEIPLPTSTIAPVPVESPSVTPTFTETPTETQIPTATETFTPEPTATPTQSPVTMTAGQNLSCVTGPNWILYKWITNISKGETVSLLAQIKYEEKQYYYVRKADGTECWAFGESSTIHGDPTTLPIKEAPALPKIKYTIENKTGLAACDVFIRPKKDTVWGADRLGASNIAIGAKFSLEITSGFYDVLIKDCSGGILYEKADRAIGSDSAYHYTALETEIKFTLLNNQGVELCQIRVQPVGGSWKEVNAAANHIANGAKLNLTLIAGKYNFEIHRCSDGTVIQTKSNVYIGSTVTGITTP